MLMPFIFIIFILGMAFSGGCYFALVCSFCNLPSRDCELTSLRVKCPPGRSFAMTEPVESSMCPNSKKKHATIFCIFKK